MIVNASVITPFPYSQFAKPVSPFCITPSPVHSFRRACLVRLSPTMCRFLLCAQRVHLSSISLACAPSAAILACLAIPHLPLQAADAAAPSSATRSTLLLLLLLSRQPCCPGRVLLIPLRLLNEHHSRAALCHLFFLSNDSLKMTMPEERLERNHESLSMHTHLDKTGVSHGQTVLRLGSTPFEKALQRSYARFEQALASSRQQQSWG